MKKWFVLTLCKNKLEVFRQNGALAGRSSTPGGFTPSKIGASLAFHLVISK
jgi:hypothetical protein